MTTFENRIARAKETLEAASQAGSMIPTSEITQAMVCLIYEKIIGSDEPKEFSHRNGESDQPELNGWYFCYWNNQAGILQTGFGDEIIMEWFNGFWRSEIGTPSNIIKPDAIYGPIQLPKIKR